MKEEIKEGRNQDNKTFPEKKSNKWWILIIVILVFLSLAFLGIMLTILLIAEAFPGPKLKGGSVAVIRLEGVISALGTEGGILPTAGVSPERITEQLQQAEEDSRVKAILLRVNSPGGTPAASEEISFEVRRAKKPVVASIADIGASGAYWAVSGSDKIVASPTSFVGSIGVYMEIPDYRELFKKIGVQYVIIKQGKYKALGHPGKKLTEEERIILERQSKIIYEKFIEEVAVGRRNLSEREVRKLATGLAFPGTEALKLGLVDKLGNFQDALDLAAKLGKIKGKPEVVEYRKPSLIEILRGLGQTQKIDLKQLLLKELESLPQKGIENR